MSRRGYGWAQPRMTWRDGRHASPCVPPNPKNEEAWRSLSALTLYRLLLHRRTTRCLRWMVASSLARDAIRSGVQPRAEGSGLPALRKNGGDPATLRAGAQSLDGAPASTRAARSGSARNLSLPRLRRHDRPFHPARQPALSFLRLLLHGRPSIRCPAHSPQAILPFQLEGRKAEAALRAWLQEGWLRLSDLADHAAIRDSHRRIYIPFWLFDGVAEIRTDDMGQDRYHTARSYQNVPLCASLTLSQEVARSWRRSISHNWHRIARDIRRLAGGDLPDCAGGCLNPGDKRCETTRAPGFRPRRRVSFMDVHWKLSLLPVYSLPIAIGTSRICVRSTVRAAKSGDRLPRADRARHRWRPDGLSWIANFAGALRGCRPDQKGMMVRFYKVGRGEGRRSQTCSERPGAGAQVTDLLRASGAARRSQTCSGQQRQASPSGWQLARMVSVGYHLTSVCCSGKAEDAGAGASSSETGIFHGGYPMTMTSRERVLTALRREQPDRVPYCELGIDRALAEQMLGWGQPQSQAANLESNPYTIEEMKAISAHLKLDNIYYVLRAPVYAHREAGQDGRLFYGEGMLKTEADLSLIDLPDPYDDALYAEAEAFARQKEDYAAWFVTRIGIFPTMLGMGMETFSIALYENLPFLERVLDIYCDWVTVVAERACQLGFDVFASTDDMAFKSAPFFSPSVFHDLVLPAYRRAAEKISLPWIIHSDGNILPFLDDLLTLGIAGLHPNEKGAMDIQAVKHEYGDRICLLGNVDLNILGMGTPQEVDQEVRHLIRDVGPGGGYIVTSGNSLAGYLKPENVMALSQAVQAYGHYPLAL